MSHTRRTAVAMLAMVAVAAVDACHKAPPPPPPAPVVNQDSINAARAAQEREAAAARARADSIARARQDSIDRANAAAAAAADQANMRAALTQVIHFDFDQSNLKDDARAALDAMVPILNANTDVTIRIAGHADERGSDEYNLALGQRRAAAAKKYLTDHGVADSRITTISYGEERPVAQGHDESAWSQNRRDEFEITAGGETLKKP